MTYLRIEQIINFENYYNNLRPYYCLEKWHPRSNKALLRVSEANEVPISSHIWVLIGT